jgi:ABC-2 type transport system ATP-binding protein
VALAVSIRDLTVRYRGASRNALEGLSLEIRSGSFFGLLGPNGAGKTTLISFLCGQIEGRCNETRILGCSRHDADYRRRLGYAPQEIALYPSLSVLENLNFFGRLLRAPRSETDRVLEWTGLATRAGDRVATLSGGMKRRLNLGVALLNRPALLVLDEPTVGIDPESRQFILDRIKSLRADGLTLIYSTHYFEEVRALCDEAGILHEGRLLASGPRETVLGKNEERYFELTKGMPS